MKNYKLLTPGPLTTTDTVKGEMMFDHCTWDDDYKQITQEIRKELLKLAHVSEEEYTAVLMQGSGTFGVEAVLTSVIGEQDKLLIASTIKTFPMLFTTFPTASISLRIPEVVSLCTMATWVMEGSFSSISRITSAFGT